MHIGKIKEQQSRGHAVTIRKFAKGLLPVTRELLRIDCNAEDLNPDRKGGETNA